MDNPFVAALLMQACEHRLRAESMRQQKIRNPYKGWRQFFDWMNASLEKSAREQDGLADVYEGFARKLLGDDYWVRWNWVTKDSYLMGPAALLDPTLVPVTWQHEYGPRWEALRSYISLGFVHLNDPLSLSLTTF